MVVVVSGLVVDFCAPAVLVSPIVVIVCLEVVVGTAVDVVCPMVVVLSGQVVDVCAPAVLVSPMVVIVSSEVVGAAVDVCLMCSCICCLSNGCCYKWTSHCWCCC